MQKQSLVQQHDARTLRHVTRARGVTRDIEQSLVGQRDAGRLRHRQQHGLGAARGGGGAAVQVPHVRSPPCRLMSTRRAQSLVSLNVEDETQTKVETKAKGKRKKVKGPRYDSFVTKVLFCEVRIYFSGGGGRGGKNFSSLTAQDYQVRLDGDTGW